MKQEKAGPVIKVSELEEVAFVVRDVDKSVEKLWSTFGIGPWTIKTVNADMFDHMLYHGKPGRFNFKLARTQNKLGGLHIELIQPLEGENIFRDFLNEHGEGPQHVGHHKVHSKEEFEENMKALEGAGFPCIMTGGIKNTAFAYFDTTKVLNTLLAMTWVDPLAKTSVPPDRIYPDN